MLTGADCRASLQDGRRVYFQGRLITDLAAEPALATPLEAIAGNYDKYYSAAPGAVNPVLTAPRPRVLEAAVIGVPDEEWGERVHAFVSLTGESAAPAQLQEFLAGRLASVKRPRTIEVLAELPKNSVGKIAKAQLREPFWRDAGRLV
jgi:acyl-CoA synthetase (AMP-forming)/AMP-acid ligase II